MKFLISNAIEHERFPNTSSSDGIVYGKAHYSWKIIARMYREALEKLDMDVRMITSPDIYQSAEAKNIVGIEKDDIHIAVKPIEHIRPVFGIRNFFICGWEFPEFSEKPLNNNPAHNHISTLKRADMILCWSTYTEDNLKRYGITKVAAIPPPVSALLNHNSVSVKDIGCLFHDRDVEHGFSYSTIREVRANYDNIFFTVLNPWDGRKNLFNLISGFSKYQSRNSGDKSALFIKLIVDNVHTKAENIIEILGGSYNISEIDTNIFFVGENLSGEQMTGLYQLFDFYMCASSTEGLNLPLIEAMCLGMVPISSAETAMKDYITEDNAILLSADRGKAGAHFSAVSGLLTLTHFPPDQQEIAAGFGKAARLSQRQRQQKAGNARRTVERRYGLSRFQTDFLSATGGR